MLPRRSGRGDAQIGLRLRKVEDLRAVREHRRRGRARVQAARVDLTEVGDEVGLDTPGLPQDLGETAQQLVVGD